MGVTVYVLDVAVSIGYEPIMLQMFRLTSNSLTFKQRKLKFCIVFRSDFSLQQFPMVENRTGPQTIEFLTKRVMALGAVQTGQFLVDCDTFMSVPAVGKSLFHSFVSISRRIAPSSWLKVV
jgi:hypothetical protein